MTYLLSVTHQASLHSMWFLNMIHVFYPPLLSKSASLPLHYLLFPRCQLELKKESKREERGGVGSGGLNANQDIQSAYQSIHIKVLGFTPGFSSGSSFWLTDNRDTGKQQEWLKQLGSWNLYETFTEFLALSWPRFDHLGNLRSEVWSTSACSLHSPLLLQRNI